MASQSSGSKAYARRDILRVGLAAALATQSPHALSALPDRRLSLYGVHTNEFVDVVYYRDGHYDSEALAQIDHAMRDHRQNEATKIDLQLIDWLHQLHTTLGAPEPFKFLSGYRTQKTNDALLAAGRGVAKKSYHLFGRAIDILPPGVPLSNLVDAARQSSIGGVGQYTRIGFVHLDTGPVRTWVR